MADGIGSTASATAVPGGPAPPPAGAVAAQQTSAAKEITQVWKLEDVDPSGRTIQRIYRATKQFVIYEAGGTTNYMLPDDYETAKALRTRVADLGGLIAKIEMLKSLSEVPKSDKHGAGNMLAWALATGFEGGPLDQAKAALTDVEARLRTLAKSELRKKYVNATLVAVAVIEAILVGIGYASWHHHGPWDPLHRYAAYCAAGGLGALLSAISGARSLDMNLDVAPWEHFLAGASRILIGVIGGLVIGLALDSHFIDPTLGHTPAAIAHPGMIDRTVAMYLLFSFISGFSETLVPNLLARGEQAAIADQKNTQGQPQGQPQTQGGGTHS
jgi:hypothetical protein